MLGVNPGRQAGRREGRPVRSVRHRARAEAEGVADGIRRRGHRRGRRGAEAKRGAKKAAAPKPRTASLFKSMQIEEVDLDTALKLLDLPRVVGVDPESGDEITAQNGRYGPYLKKGADTRTLPSEDAIFEIDLAGRARALRAAEVRRPPRVERAQGVRRRPR